MKYILLMSGSKTGVDSYRAWSKKDIDAHMAVLASLNQELEESGEFIATQGLAAPQDARLVRGFKEGMFPVAERVCRQIVTLPLFPAMNNADVERVVAAVKSILATA